MYYPLANFHLNLSKMEPHQLIYHRNLWLTGGKTKNYLLGAETRCEPTSVLGVALLFFKTSWSDSFETVMISLGYTKRHTEVPTQILLLVLEIVKLKNKNNKPRGFKSKDLN